MSSEQRSRVWAEEQLRAGRAVSSSAWPPDTHGNPAWVRLFKGSKLTRNTELESSDGVLVCWHELYAPRGTWCVREVPNG